MRILAIIVIVVLCVALACAMGAGMGYGASWVLSYFGVKVPWYVCWVAIMILGAVFGKGASK
jgi:hypothetical protein